MKKLAFILALILCFSVVLVSCDNTDTESTPADTSSSAPAESETPVEDKSEAPVESEEPVESQEPEESQPEDVNTQPAEVGDLISAGCAYEANGIYVDGEGAIPYPDESGKDLTDGVFTATSTYSEPEWVGFNKGTDAYTADGYASVVVDLGASKKIAKVGASVANATNAGITAPASISVAFSADGTTWTSPLEMAYEAALEDGVKAYASVGLNGEAQYVKFMFVASANWIFVDEVEVYTVK